MRAQIIILVALLGLAAAKSYNNYKIYRVEVNNDEQAQFVSSLSNIKSVDILSKVSTVHKPVDIMVSPEAGPFLVSLIREKGLKFTVLVEDVEEKVQNERKYHQSYVQTRDGTPKISFDKYYKHSEINEYLDSLAEAYPDIVTVSNVGKSYENRSMNIIRIATDPSKTDKPVIFVDAGIHAREWIAPAMGLYLINQLVENATNKPLIENIDWVILPSVNPDGYEYTWTTDRFWRKTRSPGTLCRGCDPNRNFGFHWMESGASSFECSETYAGPAAFSEVEARNLRDLLNRTENIVAYLTLHSYGQYLLYPWGYNDDLCDNWQELDTLGNAVNDAIRAVRGTNYTVGSSTRVLYAAAGASDDWAKSTNVDIVYTIELPGGGSAGFDLPPNQIKPVVEETFEGFKVIQKYVTDKYVSLIKH